MARKKRVGEYTCTCPAYRFPHRMSGGRCKGWYWVQDYWTSHWGSGDCSQCTSCNRDDRMYCEVVEGQEKSVACDALQEFIHYEGIRFTGIWRKK